MSDNIVEWYDRETQQGVFYLPVRYLTDTAHLLKFKLPLPEQPQYNASFSEIHLPEFLTLVAQNTERAKSSPAQPATCADQAQQISDELFVLVAPGILTYLEEKHPGQLRNKMARVTLTVVRYELLLSSLDKNAPRELGCLMRICMRALTEKVEMHDVIKSRIPTHQLFDIPTYIAWASVPDGIMFFVIHPLTNEEASIYSTQATQPSTKYLN